LVVTTNPTLVLDSTQSLVPICKNTSMEQYTNEGHTLTQTTTELDVSNFQNQNNENDQLDLSSFFASQPDPFEYEKNNGSSLDSSVNEEKQNITSTFMVNDQKEGLSSDNNTTTQTLKRKLENAPVFKELDPSNLAKRRVGLTALSDRQRVLHPDYKTPFLSTEDACNRLIPYHLFSSNNFGSGPDVDEVDTTKWKEENSKKAEELLAKFERLKQDHSKTISKTFDCVIKEDQLMFDKLNLYEEKTIVDALKRSLSTGMPFPGVISPNPLPSPFGNSFPVFSMK